MKNQWVNRALPGIIAALCILASSCATTKAHDLPSVIGDSKSEESFEEDRKAILAMAGDYEVRFQFMETASLREGYEAKKPYVAEAVEIVEVIEDSGTLIDLQHILLDREHGMVIKHWRQTWTYEPTLIYEFKGNNTWAPRKLDPKETRRAWAQYVTQVDDSPRYSGFGYWHHRGNFSSWESKTWRPLPRREYTKRSDYDVMVARNRHTITPTGWLHEQDNYKFVLGDKEAPVIALEAGLNVYTKTTEVDFSEAREYWAGTKEFWADVRAEWASIMDGTRTLKLKSEVDDKAMYLYIFGLAEDALDNSGGREARAGQMKAVIESFLEVGGLEPQAEKKAPGYEKEY
tara:strand:- start:390 stop:1427 length:1038 start_codon:yes stop_codon:yes gene_type:complete